MTDWKPMEVPVDVPDNPDLQRAVRIPMSPEAGMLVETPNGWDRVRIASYYESQLDRERGENSYILMESGSAYLPIGVTPLLPSPRACQAAGVSMWGVLRTLDRNEGRWTSKSILITVGKVRGETITCVIRKIGESVGMYMMLPYWTPADSADIEQVVQRAKTVKTWIAGWGASNEKGDW